MDARGVDRRVARTRALLQDALLALVERKDYEAITVADVCAAANVGRSTFYAHFAGKDDLKRSGIDAHLRARLAAPPGQRFGFSLPMFEHAAAYRETYRALARGRGAAVALAAIRALLAELIRRDLAAEPPGDDLPREAVAEFVLGAYMGLLLWWLDRGARLPPERMDAIFRRLVGEGLAAPLR